MERLSGLDATFLYLETPTHHMHVAMTMVLDPASMPGGYSFEKIKKFVRSRLHVVPLFRRRLVEVPFRLNHPVWIDDPDFDLDYHVRRIGAPAPGGRRELAELAGQIASTQLDRTKPLWEMWVVEGLKQDRIGIITKVHHSAVDGASGADFLVHLFDLEPIDSESFGEPDELPVEHVPNDMELLGFAAASLGRQVLNLPNLLNRTVQSISNIVKGRRSPEKLVGAVPLSAPRTPWAGSVTAHRATAFARVPLDEIKRIKNAFGCTVNDVVLALVSGTLREYLDQHGVRPDESLIGICPISVADHDEAPTGPSSNKVSGMFVSLGSDIDEIPDRIAHIRHSTRGAKEEHNAIGASMLMRWAEYASPNVFNLASRLYSSTGLASRHRAIHNVIISNIPGPNFPLYFAGAELVAAYPMGPVMEGCGLNITVFSYRESVDIGFMVCRELISDPWTLPDASHVALAELSEAADVEERRRARASGRSVRAADRDATTPETTGAGTPTREPSTGAPPREDKTRSGVGATKASADEADTVMSPPAKTAASSKTPTTKANGTSAAKKSTAKKSTVKKTAAKKSPAKKTTAKKTTAKKTAAKKTAAKKSATKKSPAKETTAKKPTAKKTTAKKTTAKKSTAKKSTAKKSPAKKSPAKKTTAKKTTAKKTTAKKTTAKKTTAKKSPASNTPADKTASEIGQTPAGTAGAVEVPAGPPTIPSGSAPDTAERPDRKPPSIGQTGPGSPPPASASSAEQAPAPENPADATDVGSDEESTAR